MGKVLTAAQIARRSKTHTLAITELVCKGSADEARSMLRELTESECKAVLGFLSMTQSMVQNAIIVKQWPTNDN